MDSVNSPSVKNNLGRFGKVNRFSLPRSIHRVFFKMFKGARQTYHRQPSLPPTPRSLRIPSASNGDMMSLSRFAAMKKVKRYGSSRLV